MPKPVPDKIRFRLLFISGVLAALAPGLPGPAAETVSGLQEVPLQPRSGPAGRTLFTLLPPEQTGLHTENRYDDPKMWGTQFREFLLGAIGTGVAAGDYDGDGRPDLFVVSKTGPDRLFRNLGNWQFEDVTAKAGVGGPVEAWKQGATFVDVNNDGKLDLYVCRHDAPNLLYINQGDGTFHEEAKPRGLAISDASVMASFCDYDRDGWLDVYLLTNVQDFNTHPHGQKDYLLHNNGDGTFTDVTAKAGIIGEGQGHSATWWDYDHDGWPDLYVANDFVVPDMLYHNNGDGTFTITLSRALPHTPNSSMGADLGDVNNDGLIDFFVADMAATTHEKDQRGMVDGRAESKDDGGNPMAAPQYSHNALFLNTGTGFCQEAAFLCGLAATDWTWAPRFEDLDNDGRLDLFVTTGMVRELHSHDLMRKLDAAQTPLERIRLTRDSPLLAEENLAFRNLGNLEFENISAAWGLNQTGVKFGAAFADFDGDGDLDLVYANYQGGTTVLRNDSFSGHRVTITLRGTGSNRCGVGAIVQLENSAGKQVRQLWPARGCLSSSEPIVHFGLGEDATINRLTVIWPSGNAQAFENVSGDQHLTITEPSALPNLEPALPSDPAQPTNREFIEVGSEVNLAHFSREKVFDETISQKLLPMRHNRPGPAIAIGDLNGDGWDDICLGGTTTDPARVLLATSTLSYKPTSLPQVSAPLVNDGPILIFDANGDGRNDLLIAKAGVTEPAGSAAYQPQLWLNEGTGTFKPASPDALPVLPVSAGALAAADFDRDGRLDVFIGGRITPGQYPLSPRSALLANRDGKFEDVTDQLAPGLREIGMVTSALWSDTDGDGWVDLLLTVEWGNVRYFHNSQGRGFEDWTVKAGFASAGTGWWSSITTADFNHDGRPDYAVGNTGLNTKYHARPDQPALLYYGVFEEGGAPQLIEAYHEGSRVVPWRSRAELGAAIPSILKKFPGSNVFAQASLAEVLGEKRLAQTQKFTATELRSGVFLSQPGGTYRFDPLPRLAQIAPIQGMVAGDFDGDSFPDLYAVQNSHAPIPSTGRFDGGLSQLLRGDGQGHFTPASPAESNLIVTGDARALAVFDLDQDGWPDFLITRNNRSTLAYRNNEAVGRSSLRVVLQGPAGNPTAIGSRIFVEHQDGSTRMAEIHAGGSYFSQSSSACFFGYPSANPLIRIKVRWPSGEVTFNQGPFQAASVILPSPVANPATPRNVSR